MKKRIGLIMLVIVLLGIGCDNEDEGPSFERQILGNWQVVTESYDPSVVEWGLFYVGSVKLNEDHSFKLNIGDQGDDATIPSRGTWKLECRQNSIVFYSYVNDLGNVYRDTTTFKVSLDNNENLVLENGWIKILHKRISELAS